MAVAITAGVVVLVLLLVRKRTVGGGRSRGVRRSAPMHDGR